MQIKLLDQARKPVLRIRLVAETVDEMDRLGASCAWHDPGPGLLTKIKAHERLDARLAG
jgi:hypothetical protein